MLGSVVPAGAFPGCQEGARAMSQAGLRCCGWRWRTVIRALAGPVGELEDEGAETAEHWQHRSPMESHGQDRPSRAFYSRP